VLGVFLAIGLVVVWFLALTANFEAFLNAALSDNAFLGAEKKRLILTERNFAKRIFLMLATTWKHSKITFVEIVLALVVVYGAMCCVMIGAWGAALKFVPTTVEEAAHPNRP